MTTPTDKHREWAEKVINGFFKQDVSILDVIAQHLAEFEAELTGWKPIDGAPRDGTKVDVISNGNRITDVAFILGEWCSVLVVHGIFTQTLAHEPTHYREITLPAQPEKEGE